MQCKHLYAIPLSKKRRRRNGRQKQMLPSTTTDMHFNFVLTAVHSCLACKNKTEKLKIHIRDNAKGDQCTMTMTRG